MTETPVISLRDVRKSYGDFELGPIDLAIEPGYVVAVVSPNGGGKSTQLRMLMNPVIVNWLVTVNGWAPAIASGIAPIQFENRMNTNAVKIHGK